MAGDAVQLQPCSASCVQANMVPACRRVLHKRSLQSTCIQRLCSAAAGLPVEAFLMGSADPQGASVVCTAPAMDRSPAFHWKSQGTMHPQVSLCWNCSSLNTIAMHWLNYRVDTSSAINNMCYSVTSSPIQKSSMRSMTLGGCCGPKNASVLSPPAFCRMASPPGCSST